MFNFTEAQEQQLNDLVDAINDIVSDVSGRITDGEDTLYAEYLESYRYGELDIVEAIGNSRLPDDVKRFILKHKKPDAIKKHIEPYLSIGVTGIYTCDEEIDSLTVGEIEEQLPEELTAQWEALNHEEKTYVSRKVDAYFPDDGDGQSIYIDHNYDRYVLLFDVDSYEQDLPPDDGSDGDDDSSDDGSDDSSDGDDRLAQIKSSLQQIRTLAKELDSLNKTKPRQIDAGLRCIDGQGLEAVDLMHYRISKRLISKRSSAKLKLVG